MAKTPYLDADELASVLADGGYSRTVSMTEASNLLLLSGLHVLRMRWIWQNPIDPIPDSLYELILEFIEEAEAQLMTNFAVGNVFASVALLSYPNVILLIGQLIPQADYPELTAVVPSSWLVGSDIQLPDMRSTFLQGAMDITDFGLIEGENEVLLTEAEMPSHTHTQNPHTHGYQSAIITPDLYTPGPVPGVNATPTPAITNPTTATNNLTGGDQPHNNVPLSLQVAWYIVVR